MTVIPVTISRLQCEHYEEPLGIGEAKPRLSWRFAGEAKDWSQVAYELRIARSDSPPNTFRVESSQSVLVPWPSEPLVSTESVRIEARAFGSDGTITPWVGITIEAGLLERDDWKAVPITCEEQPTDQPRRPFRVRSTFKAPASCTKARLYVTALGLYEVHVNGRRIGDEYLAPGWTSYTHHLVYRTFDLSDVLIPGEENVVGAWVGEGWYAGRLAFRGGWRNNYGTRPALIAQVVVDGSVVCATGADWTWNHGAVLNSELLNGETYDSRLADDTWSTSTSSVGSWRPVTELPPPTAELVSSQAPPVREVDTLRPIEVIATPAGKTVLDFGQNFAGLIRIVRQPPQSSTEITFRHAEVLEHGELGVRPLRHAAATDTVICGGPLVGYQPKFTSHGFRYAEVTGWDGVGVHDIVGVVIHSAMERTGHFSCSHKMINQLHRNVVWSTISNTISIPTDCPQRDERLGWTGDIQVFAPTLNVLFDSSGFLKSWLRDVYVDQKALGGNVPVTVPDILDDFHNQRLAVWGDVTVLTPFDLYESYADTDILREQYASGKLWLENGVVRDRTTGLWDPEQLQLSDWLAPKAPPESPGDCPTDSILVADAYLIHTTRTLGKIAQIIGENDDAARYSAEAQALTRAFYLEYVTPKGRVMSDTQTALALLLVFGIYPKSESGLLDPSEYAERFAERLGKLVEKDNWKVSTGFAGTPIILHALAKAGQLHHAYRMLQSRDCPSWLSPILLGATTIWERWDSMLADGSINPGEMTSFNHYALGSVASFLHSVVGGISPVEPGWKRIRIQPQPGGTITSATMSFNSPYGLVKCEWRIDRNERNERNDHEAERFEVDIQVPPNTTAEMILPGVCETVGSGTRHYSVPWKRDLRFPPQGKEIAYGEIPSDNWEP